MYASRLFRDFLTLVLVLGRFVAPASAQQAPVKLSGGYQLISMNKRAATSAIYRVVIRENTPCDLSRGLYCHWPSGKSRL